MVIGFRVSVADPQLINEKYGTQYIMYKVTSETDKPGFRPGAIVVDRRYSDFSWLHHELAREFPGCILPALPDKQAVGRFSADFIESRRRALERYILKICSHPQLSTSTLLITFLQASEDALSRAKGDAKASKPKLATTMTTWFEGTVNTMTTGKPELEKSAADVKVDEISTYVAQLEKHIGNAVKHSESLLKRSREISHAMFEFGQSLTFLGQSEGDTVGTGLTQMGQTVDVLSTITSSNAEQELIKFHEPLDDYIRLIQSIKSAISQRNDKKQAYVFAMADVEAKTQAHRKLQGVSGKESQAQQKEQAVRAAQDACDNAKAEFEKCTERLLNEYETFKTQKAADLKELIMNFVNLQIDYNRKAEDAWRDLLPKLETLSIEVLPPPPAVPPPNARPYSSAASGGYESFGGSHNSTNYGSASNFREEDDEYAGV